jgi:hypothetical protein
MRKLHSANTATKRKDTRVYGVMTASARLYEQYEAARYWPCASEATCLLHSKVQSTWSEPQAQLRAEVGLE